jgi:hypothetical protein
VIASPQITFASFGEDLVQNLRGFSQWVGELLNAYGSGHQAAAESPGH